METDGGMLLVWSTRTSEETVPDRGLGNKPKKTDNLPAARPIHAKDSRTFMTVRFKKHRITVLLDTGSNVQDARKY